MMKPLTRHPEGSLRELWTIAFPLMLSELSIMAMLFVDRILLARYSPEAFSAAVSASTIGWSMVLAWLVLAGISEVFVAQFNGSGQYSRLGAPVWQMIWVSLISLGFFIPMALYGGNLIWGSFDEHPLQITYFRLMLLFGFSYPFYGALVGFFIGRGEVILITILSFLANVINCLLDVILIFGIEGWVPEMGVAGAAIATSGSQIFQAGVLAFFFLSPKNRKEYGTSKVSFDKSLMWDCIRIGFPSALFAGTELMGWGVFYRMMEEVSTEHILIAGICQSLIILFYFYGEGVGKGITALAGNMIGAKQIGAVPRVLRSGVWLIVLFFFVLMGSVYFFADDIGTLFLGEEVSTETMNTLIFCIYLTAVYLLFEGLRIVYIGLMTAAGDTRFLFWASASLMWLLLVTPIYFLIYRGGGSVQLAWMIASLYSFFAYLVYRWRYRLGIWRTLSITSST